VRESRRARFRVLFERWLQGRTRPDGLRSVCLRYFNAAGAEPGLRVGEWHARETHLIPRVLAAALDGKGAEIYGTDYPTPDGTCVRDYIHVTDLAHAHEAAMNRMLSREGDGFELFHLGSESGYSVRQVIEECRRVTGAALPTKELPRRAGDPPFLVASSARAQTLLGYRPRRGLKEIIESAWEWEKRRVSRYSRKAVFLDRDGTINQDPGYLADPAQMKLLPNVREAMGRLRAAGFQLVVVSNQSGVGRGLIHRDALPRIHAELDRLLGPSAPDHYELCFHHPDENCECRKPKPKLILDSARALGIDLSRSFMVGDKQSDVEAGFRAGCAGVALVRTGEGKSAEKELEPATALGASRPDFVANDLPHAVDWILGSLKSN
jgi:histidinol-phosphate phosphatase family protein